MDQITIFLHTVPLPCIGARRRRVDGHILLVAGNRYVEIDERLDTVFGLCDGARTVKDVAQLHALKAGCDAPTALATVIAGLLVLADYKFVEFASEQGFD